jgi:hypothetical protein
MYNNFEIHSEVSVRANWTLCSETALLFIDDTYEPVYNFWVGSVNFVYACYYYISLTILVSDNSVLIETICALTPKVFSLPRY